MAVGFRDQQVQLRGWICVALQCFEQRAGRAEITTKLHMFGVLCDQPRQTLALRVINDRQIGFLTLYQCVAPLSLKSGTQVLEGLRKIEPDRVITFRNPFETGDQELVAMGGRILEFRMEGDRAGVAQPETLAK